jgi:hypothetical protein
MEEITVDAVFDAAKEILESGFRDSRIQGVR